MTNEAAAFTLSNPFKNGNKGKEYKASFTVPTDIIKPALAGLEDIGLSATYDKEASQFNVFGTPSKSGEFEIVLHYQLLDTSGTNILTQSQTFKIYINPDPRDLWKNIATDPTLEYYKTDCAVAEIKTGARTLVAASQRGRSHAHEGKPRDDDFAIDYVEESGWYVQIVADGAGSALFSREGSRIACKTALNTIKLHLSKSSAEILDQVILDVFSEKESLKLEKVQSCCSQLLERAVISAKNAINIEADKQKRKSKEYATTLLIAITKKFDFGWLIASFSIGDGAMAAYGSNNGALEVRLLGKPDEGEFGGQTRFITMDELFVQTDDSLKARTNINVFTALDAVMLMTDGISDAKFETAANLDNQLKWKDLWEEINSSATLTSDNLECKNELLKWLDFWSVGNHDDRTIAILF